MEGNSLTSFENLCKIFEMRIKLDREKGVDTPITVIDNYEKYAKKIDIIYNEEFKQNIAPYLLPASTLEKEKDRLKRLISLLEDRLEKREELEDKFYVATRTNIKGLQKVVSDSELEEKKDRLDVITRYLDTTKEIEETTALIKEMEEILKEEESKKSEYQKKNAILEDELLDTFKSIITEDKYYLELPTESIREEHTKVGEKVIETKETLDVTRETVKSLIENGNSDDYKSYVEEAEKSYYVWKNREIILKIYEILLNKEVDFTEIYNKRKNIIDLLEERKQLRRNLSIDTIDELLEFEEVLLKEKQTLDNEKEVLENITNYTNRIAFKENRLEELSTINNDEKILMILKEYDLIDTYNNDAAEEKDLATIEDTEDKIIKEEINPFRIVEIKDYPYTLNVGLAKAKGLAIRDKVNKKLNPKTQDEIFEKLLKEMENTPSGDANTMSSKTEDTDSSAVWTLPNEPLKDASNTLDNALPTWFDNTPKALDNSINSINNPGTNTNNNINNNLDNNIIGNVDNNIDKSLDNNLNIPNININENIPNIPNTNIPLNTMPAEPKLDLNNNLQAKEETSTNLEAANAFWVPISDSKLDQSTFPNITMPSNNDKFSSTKDNFGFPTFPDMNN